MMWIPASACCDYAAPGGCGFVDAVALEEKSNLWARDMADARTENFYLTDCLHRAVGTAKHPTQLLKCLPAGKRPHE
jgi:hypothetical protein